ncbi:Putative afumC-like glycosyltransferase, nucleotide-diphospho-sugar transferase [Septoria linicola]|uniref:AfumC-like glycosyltransferase, nucleotide-diphospho-sugar transferase n=1 Tax=Septoria linicola TaxID=215465 RepID=A0A9Q9BBB1_9PEZI|nr:Putative afumC-like glycosyltransferase, nucleotide-diphospho-sugar transferase [Septoria linicola]
MAPKFPIPLEFQHDLRYVELEDTRSDQEILQSLTRHTPITSEKNIWTFWHAGIAAMPAWCQRNVINWVRLCPTWTIRVLDNTTLSPNHAMDWVPRDMLPECFTKKTMEGPWTGPHSADFLRCPCLYLYGGAWLDVGCILVRSIDDICWTQLQDPLSPFTVAAPWAFDLCIANYFVAARKGDVHSIFMALWAGRTTCTDIGSHPLLTEVLPQIKFGQSRFQLDFMVSRKTLVGYVGQIVAWARLCMIEEPDGGFNGRSYYREHVMLFDAMTETSPERLLPNFDAGDFLRVLGTKLDADPQSASYQTAYKLVWSILTRSSMQKVAHAKQMTRTPQLGIYLDQKENENLDVDSSNFFELLRYGSVHYEQLRKEINISEVEGPEAVIRRRILDDG